MNKTDWNADPTLFDKLFKELRERSRWECAELRRPCIGENAASIPSQEFVDQSTRQGRHARLKK